MCGISGIVSLTGQPINHLKHNVGVMCDLLEHRGPDGYGVWEHKNQRYSFGHRRLSIIDTHQRGSQPMLSEQGSVLTFNGEIYNYLEIAKKLDSKWSFKTKTDTETILAAYHCLNRDDFLASLRGMYSFALYEPQSDEVMLVRDRFGIKPLYYTVVKGVLYFASEIKALLPFLDEIATDREALAEYLTFQYTIGEKTLFKGVSQLMPGHFMSIKNGKFAVQRYWDINYEIDYDHSPKYFYDQLQELLSQSVDLHLRSDVPIGSYVSGGIDSSLIALLSRERSDANSKAFHGKFVDYEGYDESYYARKAIAGSDIELFEQTITHADFEDNIEKVIYHLDMPVAGPGSFPQYMVSELASKHVKVVLGGQGGDEIFGGYAKYLVAYLEQCIKAAMDGSYKNGNYVVTLESIIPNMGLLKEYKPMLSSFWKEGLFGPLDERYFRLCDRSADIRSEIDWQCLDKEGVFNRFQTIFNNEKNVGKEAYFDKMTHFDFKCLLPALLHVEDRMSMAHGIESRVPMLDHRVVELAATVPADVKFDAGRMKHMLKEAYSDVLPHEIVARRDKMGFPVPLKEWMTGPLNEYFKDVFSSTKAKGRDFMNTEAIVNNFGSEMKFSRKTWGLLSLELWQQQFHDRSDYWRSLVK